MAKVFTPEEIRFDQIPEPQHFEFGAYWLMSRIRSDAELHRITDGALIIGSTTKGAANIRSDLDMVISYTSESPDPSMPLFAYKSLFNSVKQRWNVPVEANIFSTDSLQRGDHTIDPMFLLHLKAVGTEWGIGNNPVNEIVIKNHDWLSYFENYALHKEAKFKKRLLDTEQKVDYHTYQRALEIPSALGRKALGVLVQKGLIADEQFHHVPKFKINMTLEQFEHDELSKPLQDLVQTDIVYNEILHETIRDKSQLDDYADWIESGYAETVATAYDFTVALKSFVKNALSS